MPIKKAYAGKEHFEICSEINLELLTDKELAAALEVPKEEDRQPDLQYLTSVFVSTGMNLNGAYFLPSELAKAESSIINKPLDIEHNEEQVVGHMYAKVFAFKDGTVFDPKVILQEDIGKDIDSVSFDVVVAAMLYKTRFPEIAQQVEEKQYKVSMECYYKDFDLIINGIIIPKEEGEKYGLEKQVNNVVRLKEGAKELGSYTVGRVLRDMWFYGCGLVEKPANPASIILKDTSG
ncbi:hypothetical protein LCGC14_2336730 [marine sediment metagenome]|uniref:Uncharacterized protein n=1 Tax=marine sediment metagenome TaxID=412755 RepID=A0A0F9CE53_9ZZZZ